MCPEISGYKYFQFLICIPICTTFITYHNYLYSVFVSIAVRLVQTRHTYFKPKSKQSNRVSVFVWMTYVNWVPIGFGIISCLSRLSSRTNILKPEELFLTNTTLDNNTVVQWQNRIL